MATVAQLRDWLATLADDAEIIVLTSNMPSSERRISGVISYADNPAPQGESRFNRHAIVTQPYLTSVDGSR